MVGRPCYRSVDEDHIAKLYLELETWFFLVYIPSPYWFTAGYGDGTVRRNKLLVFVDKETGVVEDFFFWKEF